jgi:hypothetical protein
VRAGVFDGLIVEEGGVVARVDERALVVVKGLDTAVGGAVGSLGGGGWEMGGGLRTRRRRGA